MSWSSFSMGLLVGLIIMLLISWLTYYSRSIFFNHCASATPLCSSKQYFNDPSQAIEQGHKLESLLYLDDQGHMYHRRQRREHTCMPDRDQVLEIKHPQQCNFTDPHGQSMQAKSTHFNSPLYVTDNGQVIDTFSHCQPKEAGWSGDALLKWD